MLMTAAGRRNVEMVQKQLEKAEDEVSEALSSTPVAPSTDKSQMMEITEELDDDDNIICMFLTALDATNMSSKQRLRL
jgi:hypothetical protein